MSTAAPQENAAAATPKRSGSSPFRRRPREEAHSNEVLDHGGLPMTIAGYAAMTTMNTRLRPGKRMRLRA